MLPLLAPQYQYPKNNMDPHTHPFNGPLSGTTRVSRYQKGKPIWTLLKQETVSGSGISWAICKSAPHSRQIITPAPHHSVFYRLDALPATQPTASKHWRHKNNMDTAMKLFNIHYNITNQLYTITRNEHSIYSLYSVQNEQKPIMYSCLVKNIAIIDQIWITWVWPKFAVSVLWPHCTVKAREVPGCGSYSIN